MAASSGAGGFSSDPPAHSAPSDRANAWAFRVARPGEGEHPPSLPAADLGDDVRRGAEAIDADRLPVPGHLERAPADKAGAQQRRGRDRIEIPGERKDKRRVGDRMGGVAAVACVTGKERRVAQVLALAPAIGAMPAGMAEPGHADARAGASATPSPAASTRPTISCPGTIGSLGSGSSPSTTCRSVRQTPQASTRSRICPGPGAGSGRSSIVSRSCGRCRTMARMRAAPVQAARAAPLRPIAAKARTGSRRSRRPARRPRRRGGRGANRSPKSGRIC